MTNEPAYCCPLCGAVSHNPNDLRERYCGRCHRFGVRTVMVFPNGNVAACAADGQQVPEWQGNLRKVFTKLAQKAFGDDVVIEWYGDDVRGGQWR